jgi:hypothetical protein
MGANIDYFLADEPAGEIKLEILDARGNLMRAFTSGEAEHVDTEKATMMKDWRLEQAGTPALPKSAGMHRFTWNLRHPGPWDKDRGRSGRSGPMVPPGTYQARLTVSDWSHTVSFEAKMDPRVAKEGITKANVEAQVELALKARDAFSNARLAAARLEKALGERPGDQALAEIKKQLVTEPPPYPQPMIVDQLEYLYENLLRADQIPGDDAYNRYEELNKALEEQVQKLNQALQGTDG